MQKKKEWLIDENLVYHRSNSLARIHGAVNFISMLGQGVYTVTLWLIQLRYFQGINQEADEKQRLDE